MTTAYPKAMAALLKGDVDLLVDDVRVMLLDGDYTYASTHEFLSDVPAGGRVSSGVALASRTVTANVTLSDASVALAVFDAANTTITGVSDGAEVVAALLYVHTGVDATARLLAYFEAILTANGNDIVVNWPANGVLPLVPLSE